MLKLFAMPITSYLAALCLGIIITFYSSVGIFVIIFLMLAIRLSPDRTLYSVYGQLSTGVTILSLFIAIVVNLRCEHVICYFVNTLGVFVIFLSFFSMRRRAYKIMKITDRVDNKFDIQDIWRKSKTKGTDLFTSSSKKSKL